MRKNLQKKRVSGGVVEPLASLDASQNVCKRAIYKELKFKHKSLVGGFDFAKSSHQEDNGVDGRLGDWASRIKVLADEGDGWQNSS